VTLTVNDDDGAIDSDTVTVQIITANRPPTNPVINGTTSGIKNKVYTYTVQSTDPENDFLQYLVTWGDGISNTSDFLPNGTLCSLSHSWNSPGKYIITVRATDNLTLSEQTTLDVFIDVVFLGAIGFLFDTNNDGFYDTFYSNITRNITNTQRLTNGSYLLDTDCDGIWNYLYDPATGSLMMVNNLKTAGGNLWIFFTILFVAIVGIGVIVYFYKKKYF
jgi:hypothetical protein